MRSQLWILVQAQVLDLLFSEQPTDGSLVASPKGLEHSLDRIVHRPGSKPSLENITLRLILPVAGTAIPGGFLKQLGLGRWRVLRGLLDGQTWVDKGRQALELVCLDLTHLTVMTASQVIGSALVERSLPEASRWVAAKVVAALPGVRSLGEIVLTDGTVLFQEPKRYIGLAPHLLKDSLVLIPAPLTAAALVGGAFLKGKSIDEVWAGLNGSNDGSARAQALVSKLAQAVGLAGSEERNGPPVATLGAVETAKRLQELASLAEGAITVSEAGQRVWSRLRRAMA